MKIRLLTILWSLNHVSAKKNLDWLITLYRFLDGSSALVEKSFDTAAASQPVTGPMKSDSVDVTKNLPTKQTMHSQ